MPDVEMEIIEGPEAGRALRAPVPVEIGRDAQAAITLNDTLVSRRHARVFAAGDGLAIEDLGSRNGTFVNGQPIHSPTSLRSNDTILMGVTVLRVRGPEAASAQLTAVIPVPAALAAEVRRPAAERSVPELEPLLDARTKGKARTAPLAIFVLVVLAVLIVLAQR